MTIECKLLRSHRSTGRSWSEEPLGKATNKQSLRHEWSALGRKEGAAEAEASAVEARGRRPGKAGCGPTWLRNTRGGERTRPQTAGR